jgi:prepilin signal peptidase PulO-like enzyme (type II secretory pathway)
LSKTTKIIGWIVLSISEILIIWGFIVSLDKITIIGYQVAVLTIIWGSVAGKNVIDYKRDYYSFKPQGKKVKNDV